MGAGEAGATRLDATAIALGGRLRSLPPTKRCGSSAPARRRRVLYEGTAAGAGPAVEGLRAGPGAANLTAALRLAAGLRAGNGDEIVLLRAPEEAAPEVRGGGSSYEDEAIG